MTYGQILIVAVTMDLVIGDPIAIPHPIIYIGRLISKLEKAIRNSTKRLKIGGAFLLFLSIITVVLSIRLILLLSLNISELLHDILLVYIIYSSLASTCLAREAKKVYRSLIAKDLEEARLKIGYLVGRDTRSLDYSDIRRATVETVAENTIDGVLAPLLFIVLGIYIGYPAETVYLYKTVNTLDSMVGYKNEKYGDIGFFSAKTDDILNFIPARVGSVVMVLSGILFKYNVRDGFMIMIRDRKNHKSPNCAYPEGAVAGLLGIELGGSNIYFGELVYKPTIGDRIREIEDSDIVKASRIMYASFILLVIIICFLQF